MSKAAKSSPASGAGHGEARSGLASRARRSASRIEGEEEEGSSTDFGLPQHAHAHARESASRIEGEEEGSSTDLGLPPRAHAHARGSASRIEGEEEGSSTDLGLPAHAHAHARGSSSASSPSASSPRPLRADAERNLRRLLDAAAAAFAEHGWGVPVEEVARRAGVGKATVFRRFPTKGHLIAAILRDRLQEAISLGGELLDARDAGDALRRFMRAGARMQAEDKGFFEALADAGIAADEVMDAKRELLAVTASLLARAQAEGSVRGDVAAEDILMLTCASVQAAAPFYAEAPELWSRYLDISFDGLCSGAAHPLSAPLPATPSAAVP